MFEKLFIHFSGLPLGPSIIIMIGRKATKGSGTFPLEDKSNAISKHIFYKTQ